MIRVPHLLRICFLALALLLGQHAAQLHALAHATFAIEHGVPQPGSDTCDQCSLYAPFSAAAASFVAPPVVLGAEIITAFSSFLPALSRTVVSSRSRAPPASA
jgi:hypothetical protein